MRYAIGYVLLAACGLGYELGLVTLVRRPLLLTWPLALVGAQRNAQEARRTLRMLNTLAYFAWDWAGDP